MQGRFEDLAENIGAWFDDLSIVRRDGKSTIRQHKIAAVFGAMVRDLRDIPPPTVATIWRSAVQNRAIPLPLVAKTLARVRINVIKSEPVKHAGVGLLRAFVIRSSEIGISTMATNVDDSITSTAYLCGRIMAVLAAVQNEALGDVGAGIVQRYYAAASATPALVLGRLIRTAQIAHFPKIREERKGLRIYYEKQLADLWGQMTTPPPTALSLEEQTLFALGFYQQQAARYQKKETEPNSTAATQT
jgi:CRISPR-associated protein Csd1